MKVLMINSVCGIGSTGRICTEIAQELDRQGQVVKIAYGRDGYVPEEFQKYAVRIGNDFEVRLHGMRARLLDEAGLGSRRATIQFIRWVRQYNPDIIHLHNIHGYYINIEVLFDYLKTCGKPVIWTLHDCWAMTGHCAYFNFVHCDKWQSAAGCRQCPGLKEYPVSLGMDRSNANYRLKRKLFRTVPNLTLVTPSKWLAGIVSHSFLKNKPVRVIHNGINIDNFHPSEGDLRAFGITTDRSIILGVSSDWDRRKGLGDFVKLDNMLRREFPDIYQIVLVGIKPEQKEELPDDIVCVPKTNNVQELAQLYTRALVLFNPTYGDNYPTVNLEARACGTRVITYRGTGGSAESAGKDGITVNPGDISAVVDTVQKIRKFGPKQARVLPQEISNRMMVQKYIDLYSEVLEQSGRKETKITES